MARKLYRSRSNKMIAGVCGGLGEYLEIDPTIIRLMMAISAVFVFTGAIIYVIAWFVMPVDETWS